MKKIISGLTALAIMFGCGAVIPETFGGETALIARAEEWEGEYTLNLKFNVTGGKIKMLCKDVMGDEYTIDIPEGNSTLSWNDQFEEVSVIDFVSAKSEDLYDSGGWNAGVNVVELESDISISFYVEFVYNEKVGNEIVSTTKRFSDEKAKKLLKRQWCCFSDDETVFYYRYSFIVNTIYDNDIVYEIKDDNTLSVYTYLGEDSYVNIPSEVAGKTVISINSGAFWGNWDLENIVIPESVTKIGGGAFSGTLWLANQKKKNPLVIINNIVIDGEDCKGDVVIPNGTTTICGSAFVGGDILDSITIPSSVNYIEDNAFLYYYDDLEIYYDYDDVEPEHFRRVTGVTKYTKCIYGYIGTVAHKYALDNGIKFIPLDEDYTPAPGDADGDGQVNIKDVMLIQQAIVGWKVDVDLSAADVNKDGSVNIKDVMLIQQAIVGWKVTLL